MRKDNSIPDNVCNIFNQDKILEEQAADLGELIMQREREESSSIRNKQKLAELDRMITLQKRLVLRMVNEDEKEIQSSLPKKSQLKIVK